MTNRAILYRMVASTAFMAVGCHPDESLIGGMWDAGVIITSSDAPKTMRHVFTVNNTTNNVVRILQKDCSCTCTDTEIADTLLNPGQATTLTMNVKVPSGPVFWRVQCVLRTDYPSQPDWTYAAQFKAVPNLTIDPQTINFGVIRAEPTDQARSPTMSCTVDKYDDIGTSTSSFHPLQIRSISQSHDITATPGSELTIDVPYPGVRRSRLPIDVSLTSKAISGTEYEMLGSKSRTINVTTADGLTASALVSWQLKGPVTCSPASVHFGTLTPQNILSQNVISKTIIATSQDAPLILKGISIPQRDIGIINAEAVNDASDSAAMPRLQVTLRTSSLQHPIQPYMSGEIEIRFQLRNADHNVKIPWSAFYIDHPPTAEQPITNPRQ